MRQFWIVWSPTGTTPPSVTHGDRGSARRAAVSMAKQHPGQEFFVLKAESVSVKADVYTMDLCDGPGEIPF